MPGQVVNYKLEFSSRWIQVKKVAFRMLEAGETVSVCKMPNFSFQPFMVLFFFSTL